MTFHTTILGIMTLGIITLDLTNNTKHNDSWHKTFVQLGLVQSNTDLLRGTERIIYKIGLAWKPPKFNGN